VKQRSAQVPATINRGAEPRESQLSSGMRVLIVTAVVGLLLICVSEPLQAQRAILDNTQDAYRATSRAWLGPISAIARRLFVTLAALEVSISAVFYVLRRDALDEMAGKFLVKFIVLSAVLMCITSAGYWLPPIVNGFASAGQAGSGGGFAVGPSGIVDMGLNIALYKIDTTGLPLTFASLETALYALTSRLVILGSFLVVAVMVLLTWVEAYVALAGGVLFLGLGGFRATAQYAENYLGFLVYIGVRLFLLYLLLGIGVSLITTEIAGMPPAMRPEQMGELLAISVTFAAITTIVPRNMASRIAGTSNFGIAQALRSL
jgi:type IV secretion system protein TrbL